MLSTSSAFRSVAVKVTNSPRAYSYPLTTSRMSISSPVAGSCGRSVTRVAARLWSPSRDAPPAPAEPVSVPGDLWLPRAAPSPLRRQLQLAEFEPQQLRVPPGTGDRQLIVGQHIRPLLRLAPPRSDHHRDLGDAELPGGEYPRVARNQPAVLAHQRRARPTPLPDARGYRAWTVSSPAASLELGLPAPASVPHVGSSNSGDRHTN